MKEEIKEILDYIDDRIISNEKWNKIKDYITNLQESYDKALTDLVHESHTRMELQEENERLNREHKAIKKYVHNHTITYIDNGIECCKPDEYFNILWVENMLCGNFENLETLLQGEDKE